jgi:hypothetical protein
VELARVNFVWIKYHLVFRVANQLGFLILELSDTAFGLFDSEDAAVRDDGGSFVDAFTQEI